MSLAIERVLGDAVGGVGNARSIHNGTLHKKHRLPVGKISLDLRYVHQ
jgi:hypothetical protein